MIVYFDNSNDSQCQKLFVYFFQTYLEESGNHQQRKKKEKATTERQYNIQETLCIKKRTELYESCKTNGSKLLCVEIVYDYYISEGV